jgi:beta-fructofuranosidase
VSVDYSTLPSGAVYFQINTTDISTGTFNFNFTSSSTGESVFGGYNLGGDFWLSRRNVHRFGDTNPFFNDRFSVTNPLLNNAFTLEVIIDRSIIELFFGWRQELKYSDILPRRQSRHIRDYD